MKFWTMIVTLLLSGAVMAQEPAQKPAEAPADPAPRESRFSTVDRLELETTSITGNRELPKVMYIVPWKKADLGDLSGKPARSLIDEVLAPVDREVFRREVDYYEAMTAPQAKP
jgi:hypothetical protein